MAGFGGKIVVITGAGQGVGLGMAEAFAEAGAHVVLSDVDEEAAQAAAAALAEQGATTLGMKLDVTDRAAWDHLARRVESVFGPVDILCNNAGVTSARRPLHEIPLADWRWLLEINLFGVLNGLHCFVPRLKARRSGHIVNTASLGGVVIQVPNHSEFGAAKHAVVGLTESLRLELAGDDVGVSVFCPGYVTSTSEESARRLHSPVGPPPIPEPEATVFSRGRYISAYEAGRCVLKGIERNLPYIFTHRENRKAVETHFAEMLSSFEALDPSS